VREKTYYYMLEAWHICKNKYTATSNMATALWLTVKQESPVNLLSWEPYLDWNSDAQYEIYRKIGDNFDDRLATITDPSSTVFRDDLSNVLIDGDICYWITAKPVSPNLSGQQAFSNRICIKPESDIFIPQAFTPNVAGINAEFKPFFSYPPQDYIFVAYDRIGAKVFETKDIDAGWDGRLMNGKPANEGIYTYYLRFRTAMGRLIEKTGTFALLLP
jgi:gliding motility-associated-like protein